MNDTHIEQAYGLAKERYAELGVDTEAALAALAKIPVSLHCWQGDDVAGFEHTGDLGGSGLSVTGNYPGRARRPEELRADYDKALGLIPGTHRANIHAIYCETGGAKVDRDELGPEHFAAWIDWAKDRGLGLDFNPTYFAHPNAADGFTLSSADTGRREFWIRHGQACRRIAAAMGKATGSPTVCNVWIPDGYKDTPANRKAPRERLRASLDEIFAEDLNGCCLRDAVECKLFGIGSESYVVGSHEFYMGYATSRGKLLCLDAGHFHPTEVISDKISAVLEFVAEVLLHVSRGVRWDSDHVVVLDGELKAIASEIVRGAFVDRVHIGLDFFDASINRIAAWVIGTRAMLQALLAALLEPTAKLQEMEREGDLTGRLAMMELVKALPAGAVWDRYCQTKNVPVGWAWMDEVREYEKTVLAGR